MSDTKDVLLDQLCDEVERLRRGKVALALDLEAARKQRDELHAMFCEAHERHKRAEAEADMLRAALREVLGWMSIPGQKGPPCRRSGWIAEQRVRELERLARGGGGGR